MAHLITLGVLLVLFWLALSGHYSALLLGLGALSVLLILYLTNRIEGVEKARDSAIRPLKLLGYLPWLIWEVVKSNIDVTRAVLAPDLPVRPTMVRLRGSQKTDIGRVVHANSITLTPGTLTVDLDGDTFLVHALTRSAAETLRDGVFDRRASELEIVGKR